MDKAITEELFSFANQRRAQEFAKWQAMSGDSSEWEAQRLYVAAWATAANELYEQTRDLQASSDRESKGDITYGNSKRTPGSRDAASARTGATLR
jgi:hypothetical protein